MAPSVHEQLKFFIAERYADREQFDLGDFLYDNHLFRGVDEDFVDFVFTHRNEMLVLLADEDKRRQLIDEMADATRVYTWERNQYLALPGGSDTLLASLYDALVTRSAHALRDAASRDALRKAMRHVIDAHHERLLRFFAAVCPTDDGGQPAESFLRSVPCDEYSAELQLTLLALEVEQLQQPVLDLGCGSEGRLMHFLHNAGVAGLGVDRLAPRAEGFLRLDWMQAPLDAAQWGTVVAHQSFSLHFLFHHRHQTGLESRFAQHFMQILHNLRPGGRFCYTPGLPFFEKVLADEPAFRIMQFPHNLNSSAPSDVAYATHIQRIAS
ncbi:class I SAM-dependent methyltransferase [bacterium]|nr:class I SAM-dependent methyltransferase [bacterium]